MFCFRICTYLGEKNLSHAHKSVSWCLSGLFLKFSTSTLRPFYIIRLPPPPPRVSDIFLRHAHLDFTNQFEIQETRGRVNS